MTIVSEDPFFIHTPNWLIKILSDAAYLNPLVMYLVIQEFPDISQSS